MEKNSEKFEPSILLFMCNWCTSVAADTAGVSRLQYPVNVKPIRVMCSGSVDPFYVLKGLLIHDAVVIGGCPPGDCHYISGNLKARRRAAVLMAIFEALGLEVDRFMVKWISAAEGTKFARLMTEITEAIRRKGPNPLTKRQNV